jgi:hypothetical protein
VGWRGSPDIVAVTNQRDSAQAEVVRLKNKVADLEGEIERLRAAQALDRRASESADSGPTAGSFSFKGKAQVTKLTRETQTQSARALVEKSRRRASRGRARPRATRRDT